MPKIADSGRFAVAVAALALRHPVEVLDRYAGRRERQGQQLPPTVHPTHADGVQAAHELLGVESCDDCAAQLPAVEAAVLGRLTGQHHHDGGTAMAQLLWCLVRHLRPERVVETGVARGISSAFTLDALHRNGTGHLWSIDLPPINPGWAGQTGSAVRAEHRQRWTYVRGASRRRLPPLLRQLGTVDLFTHDGLHTRENQLFEYRTVWPHLAMGGVLATDDADDNDAFLTFAQDVGRRPLLVRETEKVDVVGLLRRDAEPAAA